MSRLHTRMKNPIFLLTFVLALGCGLVSGIFFAFSTFIMRALTRLPPAQGIAAMQAINVDVLNRWFFAAFFGTALCCLVLAVSSFFRWHKPDAIHLLAGSLLYLVGTGTMGSQLSTRRVTAQAAFGRPISRTGQLGIMCGLQRRWGPRRHLVSHSVMPVRR